MSYYLRILIVLAFLAVFTVGAYAQAIPSGRAISLDNIIILSQSIGGFLFILGGILAGITIILSGLTYFLAGGDQQKVKAAKDILKAGIIGSLIIFGAGVIINTIKGFATDPLQFFQ